MSVPIVKITPKRQRAQLSGGNTCTRPDAQRPRLRRRARSARRRKGCRRRPGAQRPRHRRRALSARRRWQPAAALPAARHTGAQRPRRAALAASAAPLAALAVGCTHLYHVCACGFDTSKIHINTFINTCVFMYQGGGDNSHPWAALSLPVLIHMQSSLWGGDSDWSCIDLYRSVSRNIDTAACIEY